MRCGLQIRFAKHVELQAPLPQKPNFSIKHPLVVLSCAYEGMKQKGGPLIRGSYDCTCDEIVRSVWEYFAQTRKGNRNQYSSMYLKHRLQGALMDVSCRVIPGE